MKHAKAWEFSRYMLECSLDELDSAQTDFLKGEVKFRKASCSTYYAVFYAMNAVLALDGVDFQKHSAVQGYFRREYLATNVFDRKYSDIITATTESRNAANYPRERYVIKHDVLDGIIQQTDNFYRSVSVYVLNRIEDERLNSISEAQQLKSIEEGQEEEESEGMTL